MRRIEGADRMNTELVLTYASGAVGTTTHHCIAIIPLLVPTKLDQGGKVGFRIP